MIITWSLSGMLKGTKIDVQSLIGKPIYLDNCKTVGYITDVFPETDLVCGEIPDKEYDKLILESQGTAMCSFEICTELEKQSYIYRERAAAIGITLEELEYFAMMSGWSVDTRLKHLESFIKPTPQFMSLGDLAEFLEEEDEGLSAAEIRKRLKYEKNPMRIKQLNKMLNGVSKKVRIKREKKNVE